MASNRVMGKAQIKVNGDLLLTHPGASLDLGGEERESVAGANSIHGFKGQMKPSKLECEISVKQGTSLAAIRNWIDVTVTFEADTGQTWIVPGGWTTETPSTTDNDGKAKIVIEGPPAEEIIS